MPMKTRQMWWCFFHSMHSIPLFNTQTHTGTHNSMLCGCPHPKPVDPFPVAANMRISTHAPFCAMCPLPVATNYNTHLSGLVSIPVSIFYHFNFYNHLGTFHISSSDSVVIFLFFVLLFPHASMFSLKGVATHGYKVLWKLYPNMLCMTDAS